MNTEDYCVRVKHRAVYGAGQEAHRCSKACLVELQKHFLLPLSINEEVSLLPKNPHHDRRKSTLELGCELP